MIYTLTLNPALDYTLRLDTLCLGETNRSVENYLRLGGKGLNVSAVLSALGEKSVAYAFAAGEIGELMKEKAKNFAFPIKWPKASG
jgi:1-phosphofructokinase